VEYWLFDKLIKIPIPATEFLEIQKKWKVCLNGKIYWVEKIEINQKTNEIEGKINLGNNLNINFYSLLSRKVFTNKKIFYTSKKADISEKAKKIVFVSYNKYCNCINVLY